jgi:uncharacterized membrane protein
MAEQISLHKPKTRLYFIDMARTIAILLMLEGHFVHDSLSTIYVSDSYPAYVTWKFIRGFTSPTFLTVTGLIFTYLLLGNEQESFWKNMRVRKGFKRVVELLFWGYLLQYYAFHVLQCIAVGILSIILLYGLFRFIKVVPLWIYYFIAGTLLFYSQLFFGNLGTQYWPENAPTFVQNMFHGPHSEFPITPSFNLRMFRSKCKKSCEHQHYFNVASIYILCKKSQDSESLTSASSSLFPPNFSYYQSPHFHSLHSY